LKTNPPNILITGDLEDLEVRSHLTDTFGHARAIAWNELMARINAIAAAPDQELAAVDLIVIVQIRRGEYLQAQVDTISVALPLAAIVVTYGPWCEGETRSGHPLSNVTRVAISGWPLAFERFLSEFQKHGTSQWHQPPVVSDLQRILDPPWPSLDESPGDSGCKMTVALYSVDRVSMESLSFLIKSAGWDTSGQDETTGSKTVDVIVVDCYFSIDEAITAASRWNGAIPVVAILGFARQSDRDRLLAVSPESIVIGKPFSNDDLRQAILQVTGNRTTGIAGL
jgi:CheY-like chemotaxis protein